MGLDQVAYADPLAGQGRPDETSSARHQTDGRDDERPGRDSDTLGHLLVEQSSLLQHPDIKTLRRTPDNVLAANLP